MEKTHKIQVEIEIDEQTLEDLVVTALEGGINYWALLHNEIEDFYAGEDPGEATSIVVWHRLRDGKPVGFSDQEEDEGEIWFLTLEKLLNGIKLNAEKRPFDCNLENMDAVTADCIFQYALFGAIIYG